MIVLNRNAVVMYSHRKMFSMDRGHQLLNGQPCSIDGNLTTYAFNIFTKNVKCRQNHCVLYYGCVTNGVLMCFLLYIYLRGYCYPATTITVSMYVTQLRFS